MKNINRKFIAGMAVVLALVLGLAAFAENTETEILADEPEIVEEVTEVADDETAETEETDADAQDDTTALQEALEAYRSAKAEKSAAALEDELNEMVEAGQLTQEQADLILNKVKEQQALKNGQCPNCGYQFQKGRGNNGRGGSFRGGKGGNGGRGGKGGCGWMNGMNQMPQQNAQQQNMPQQNMPRG